MYSKQEKIQDIFRRDLSSSLSNENEFTDNALILWKEFSRTARDENSLQWMAILRIYATYSTRAAILLGEILTR